MSEETPVPRPRVGDMTVRQAMRRVRLIAIGAAVGVGGIFLAASIAAASDEPATPRESVIVVPMCDGASDYNCLETEDEAGSPITGIRLRPRA